MSPDNPTNPLVIRAGPDALARVRQHGLRRGDVQAIAGAAGGPKWLVLSHLDRFLFGDWLGTQPVELVGSSIGAWRFAAACHPTDPAAAIARLERAYLGQRYSSQADRGEITRVIGAILDCFLDEQVAAGVVGHQSRRLTAITVRARGLAASERRMVQALGTARRFWPIWHPGERWAVFSNACYFSIRKHGLCAWRRSACQPVGCR